MVDDGNGQQIALAQSRFKVPAGTRGHFFGRCYQAVASVEADAQAILGSARRAEDQPATVVCATAHDGHVYLKKERGVMESLRHATREIVFLINRGMIPSLIVGTSPTATKVDDSPLQFARTRQGIDKSGSTPGCDRIKSLRSGRQRLGSGCRPGLGSLPRWPGSR